MSRAGYGSGDVRLHRPPRVLASAPVTVPSGTARGDAGFPAAADAKAVLVSIAGALAATSLLMAVLVVVGVPISAATVAGLLILAGDDESTLVGDDDQLCAVAGVQFG